MVVSCSMARAVRAVAWRWSRVMVRRTIALLDRAVGSEQGWFFVVAGEIGDEPQALRGDDRAEDVGCAGGVFPGQVVVADMVGASPGPRRSCRRRRGTATTPEADAPWRTGRRCRTARGTCGTRTRGSRRRARPRPRGCSGPVGRRPPATASRHGRRAGRSRSHDRAAEYNLRVVEAPGSSVLRAPDDLVRESTSSARCSRSS